MIIYLLLSPEDFISVVEASPSGKFETKIAMRNAIFIIPPEASVIPSAAFSGILSMTDPMNKDIPEGGLLPVAALLSATSFPLFEDLLFDFLSRIAFAMPYEIPPKMNPNKVAGRE